MVLLLIGVADRDAVGDTAAPRNHSRHGAVVNARSVFEVGASARTKFQFVVLADTVADSAFSCSPPALSFSAIAHNARSRGPRRRNSRYRRSLIAAISSPSPAFLDRHLTSRPDSEAM